MGNQWGILNLVKLSIDVNQTLFCDYRLCFIVTLFFMLFSLIMINVKSSKDPRAGIQNGFWAIKFMIIIGGMIGAFFIPVGTFGK